MRRRRSRADAHEAKAAAKVAAFETQHAELLKRGEELRAVGEVDEAMAVLTQALHIGVSDETAAITRSFIQAAVKASLVAISESHRTQIDSSIRSAQVEFLIEQGTQQNKLGHSGASAAKHRGPPTLSAPSLGLKQPWMLIPRMNALVHYLSLRPVRKSGSPRFTQRCSKRRSENCWHQPYERVSWRGKARPW